MINIFKKNIKRLLHNNTHIFYDFMRRNTYIEQTNLNLNLCDKSQKRVLISYVPIPNFDFNKITHAQSTHINQIIYAFIKRGFCIDVCYANDIMQYNRTCKKYDIIFGFGDVYKQACNDNKKSFKIAFITENHPDVVTGKYKERKEYFKRRHPHINITSSIMRSGFYDAEQFKFSDAGILMNSAFNALNFKEFGEKLFLVHANSIFNNEYEFIRENVRKSIAPHRKSFLWFGSSGLIHKGLDIVIDTFREIPGLTLDVYGMDPKEYSLFDKIKAPNTFNRKRINVMSNAFIEEVVMKHNFVIMDSCSEGMSTAIATCMSHGIIPIVSKECGFDVTPCIIQLDDNSVEGVKNAIMHTFELSEEEILNMRQECYEYARKNFSLTNFNHEFCEQLDKILIHYNNENA